MATVAKTGCGRSDTDSDGSLLIPGEVAGETLRALVVGPERSGPGGWRELSPRCPQGCGGCCSLNDAAVRYALRMIVAQRTLRENHPSDAWQGTAARRSYKMGLWNRLAGRSAAPTTTRPDVQTERVTRDRGEAFERFSRVVDGPMMILALAMIPLIVVPVIVDLSPGLDRAFVAIDYLVWAVFAVEYVVKLCLAPDR